MIDLQFTVTLTLFITVVSLVYTLIGWKNVLECVKMYTRKKYWVDYNIVEAMAWYTKAAVILPALLYGKEIWQLHFLTLFTSALLIWASRKKNLPTLVIFNTMWIGISSIVIVRNVL